MHVGSMVCGGPAVEKAKGGAANTTANENLGLALRIEVGAVKFHFLFLAPLVLFSIPLQGLLGLNIPVLILITVSGISGNLLARKRFSTLASIALVCLLVWGRVADDLFNVKPPDTAIFLVEFGMRQGKIAVGSLGISLALLPLAGFTSISTQQLPITGALLLIAVIALLFLVTYRREPERRLRNR